MMTEIDWTEFEPFKPSEEEILRNKTLGKIYVANFSNKTGKYISIAIKPDEEPYDVSIKISPRIEIRITYLERDNQIHGVQITKMGGKQIEKINLSTFDWLGVLRVLQVFSGLDLNSIANGNIILDSSIVHNPEGLKTHLRTILKDPQGAKIIEELSNSGGSISLGDIANLTQKKHALEEFNKLLHDKDYFEKSIQRIASKRAEDVWQIFFEQHKWIFGYGLEYVFNGPISKHKFQQTLRGSSLVEAGKRPDGILKTIGAVQFLNIVEIKTHNTALLKRSPYRNSQVWQISDELSGSITQCQQYVRASAKAFGEITDIKDADNNRTGEEVFNFQPKCFLIVGNLSSEFLNENGDVANPDKVACFECYKSCCISPEIITFDQLYYRAKMILDNADKSV